MRWTQGCPALLLFLLWLLPSPVSAGQHVRIETWDGVTVEGVMLAPIEDGYRVQTSVGVQIVPFGAVKNFTQEDLPAANSEASPAALQDPPIQHGQVAVRDGQGHLLRGLLLDSGPRGLRLSSKRGKVTVPWDGPAQIVLTGPPREELAAPRGGGPTFVLHHPGWERYRKTRLRLRDRKRRWVGPQAFDYRGARGRWDDPRFVAYVGDQGSSSLKLKSFLDLCRSEELLARWSERDLLARRSRQAGRGLLIGGPAVATVGLVMLIAAAAASIGGASRGDASQIAGIAGGVMLGFGGAFSGTGAGLLSRGRKADARLRGKRLGYLMSQEEAWSALQQHNSELRRAAGLPDDPMLDGNHDDE